ncbi:MAG: PaaI family thioesterase [Fluviicola sp.]|nr:PaaI family thioesterase [Fluviicola sp.]
MQLENLSLEQLNDFNKNTIIELLGIEVVHFDENSISARMPVDKRTQQPLGLLHGGASVVLIESLGSVGSSLLIDLEKEYPVGLEVNANHIGSARSGNVIGIAKILHKGKKTHVWTVDIKDEESGRLICTGRLTVMIVQKK